MVSVNAHGPRGVRMLATRGRKGNPSPTATFVQVRRGASQSSGAVGCEIRCRGEDPQNELSSKCAGEVCIDAQRGVKMFVRLAAREDPYCSEGLGHG